MKKFGAIFLIAVAAMTLTSCGISDEPLVDGSTRHVTKEAVVSNGEIFDCLFYKKGYRDGVMDCTDRGAKAPVGLPDTERFTRNILVVNGEKSDCLFYNEGYVDVTMACFPVKEG